MKKVVKSVKNFGGRPTEREPEAGKRTHLSLAVPLTLKQKLEEAAVARGWSVSNEATHRLERSFDQQGVLPEIIRLAWPQPPGFADMLIEAAKVGQLELPPEHIEALWQAIRPQIEDELRQKKRAKK